MTGTRPTLHTAPPKTRRTCAGVGRGAAMAHHGEVLQGQFDGPDGTLVHGIVTLPYPGLTSTAHFVTAAEEPLVVRPQWKSKARAAAQHTLRQLGVAAGGLLQVDSDIAIERGLGSSTADVVSSIIAVAAACEHTFSPEEIARIAVHAEGASDAVMFDRRAVLFASRAGHVIEDFGDPLPQVELLGFDPGGSGVPTVPTVGHEPAYSQTDLGTFRALRGLLRRALADRSPALLATVASASTRVNQRYLPNPAFELVCRVAGAVGALGYQTAHTGRVMALLFDPADPETRGRIAAAVRLLHAEGVHTLWQYRLGSETT